MTGPSQQAPARGWFISIEGIDGAGKSSHIEAIATALRAQGNEVLVTREPGGTALGEQLRELLLHHPMDAVAETLLAFASRRQHLLQVIVPALANGTTVVCDRFTDATFAYQGAGRGVAWEQLAQLQRWVQGGFVLPEAPAGAPAAPPGWLQPDCTLWFDVPAEVAAARLQKARTPDRFESEARAFFEQVASGYARRAAAEPLRFARIESHADKPVVQQRVLAALRARGIVR